MEEDEAHLKEVTAMRSESFDEEYSDSRPLIHTRNPIVLGASNIMAQWTSHLMKCFLVGLTSVTVVITFTITYISARTTGINIPHQHIILLDSTDLVSVERACAAESVVRSFVNVPCYFYIRSNPTPTLTLLADAYPNLYLRTWTWIENLKDTPAETWVTDPSFRWISLLDRSTESLELIARALVLWKYGGTSMSLDWLMEDVEECLGVGPFRSYNRVDAHTAVIFKLEPCHVFSEKLIEEIKENVENVREIDVGHLLRKVLRSVCPGSETFEVLPQDCLGLEVFNASSKCATRFPKDWNNIAQDNCPQVKSMTNLTTNHLNQHKMSLSE